VSSFILDNLESHFSDTSFFGLYRDDGLLIFNCPITKNHFIAWLATLQSGVDDLFGNSSLQFTGELWKPGNHCGHHLHHASLPFWIWSCTGMAVVMSNFGFT
jgi:hypothetical protein